ncbi:MAG: peptidase U32 family protein [Bacteroidota bacterium]
MNTEHVEIMSPVGSYESLAAAINAGASSVYFGLEMLNMRARSSQNFTLSDLSEIVSICRKNSVKTYVTVNTLLYDSDLEILDSLMRAVKEHDVSAVIVSDIAAIQVARKYGVEVHISTQLNISNIEAVRFYAQFAEVMVLARELNLKQVQAISDAIIQENIIGPSGKRVQIEMFVHGALCMSISGKCYLSLHEQNASANRGACMQTCRKGYIVSEKESGDELEVDNEYIMSPKDLCTIGFIDELIDAGVSVFKIEGRARSPEYVKTVTQCYKEAVESYANNNYTEEKITEWREKLSKVFNRGFWNGYYLGQRLGEWSKQYGSSSTTYKMKLGICTNFFTKLGVAEFTMQSGELSVGDTIYIIGKTTGVVEMTVPEIRVELQSVRTTQKGEVCSVKIPELVRRGDALYKVVSKE